jgi:hypothetical protein
VHWNIVLKVFPPDLTLVNTESISKNNPTEPLDAHHEAEAQSIWKNGDFAGDAPVFPITQISSLGCNAITNTTCIDNAWNSFSWYPHFIFGSVAFRE